MLINIWRWTNATEMYQLDSLFTRFDRVIKVSLYDSGLIASGSVVYVPECHHIACCRAMIVIVFTYSGLNGVINCHCNNHANELDSKKCESNILLKLHLTWVFGVQSILKPTSRVFWLNLRYAMGFPDTGLILGLYPANERRRYKGTPSHWLGTILR